jgi:hypothetical protein
MGATAGIIAAALSALGGVAGGVAGAAHGGPPSPLGQKPGGGFSYMPSAARMQSGSGTPSGQLRLSDIMGGQAPQDDEMTLRMLLAQQAG